MDPEQTTNQAGAPKGISPDPAQTSASTPPAAPSGAAGGVDLASILLPKKEAGSSTLSAQRVNASAVLDAATAPLEPTAPRMAPAPARPTPAQTTPGEENVSALRTFKTDIEDTVHSKNVSLIDIAAAQAGRHSPTAEVLAEETAARTQALFKYWWQILLGIALIIAAGSIFFFLTTRTSSVPGATQPAVSLIFVDDTKPVVVAPQESRLDLMTELAADRESTSIALGLISRLYLTGPAPTSTSSGAAPLTTEEFFSTVAPNAPDTLVRSLGENYLLGVHVFDGNQPFLIFKTNSYEQAFAGMLNWENTMQSDLLPLFNRIPRPRIPEESATSTASTTEAAPAQFLQTPFIDRIVENHNARVIQNGSGDILLLWTFIDRQTLVITTNEYTLREIISRLADAPTVAIPGQK